MAEGEHDNAGVGRLCAGEDGQDDDRYTLEQALWEVEDTIDGGFSGIRLELLGIQSSMLVDMLEAQTNGASLDHEKYLGLLTDLKSRYDILVYTTDCSDSSVWSIPNLIRKLQELIDRGKN